MTNKVFNFIYIYFFFVHFHFIFNVFNKVDCGDSAVTEGIISQFNLKELKLFWIFFK